MAQQVTYVYFIVRVLTKLQKEKNTKSYVQRFTSKFKNFIIIPSHILILISQNEINSKRWIDQKS